MSPEVCTLYTYECCCLIVAIIIYNYCVSLQILMEEPASQKCDVYSYAIVLWELATFQVPLEGLSVFQIMTTVAKGEVKDTPLSVCS